jgi:hypothetical protein
MRQGVTDSESIEFWENFLRNVTWKTERVEGDEEVDDVQWRVLVFAELNFGFCCYSVIKRRPR